MKQLMRRVAKTAGVSVASLAIALGMTASAIAGFGPDRPTKVWTQGVTGFDYVTFNSFTGVPNGIGDERDFFRGVQVGRDSVWADPVKNVGHSQEVEAKIYIHNGASAGLNDQPGNPGVAKNVTVRVALPTGTAQSQNATAYISADNANPGTVFDTLTMTGENNGFFGLEYVPGSAKVSMHGQATAISDSLVTTGVNLGDVKGCFEFVREITFRMKVNMPNYSIAKTVRLEGQGPTDWKETMAVQPGQTVEWRIRFDNIGETTLENVKILDVVPTGMTVVPGTVRVINNAYPTGYTFDNSAIQANGRHVNVDIGDHAPGGGSYVTFKAKVDSADKLACGVNKLVNNAYATPEGYGSIRDDANVTVNKECQPPTTSIPNTGAGDVFGLFVAVTVGGAVAHRVYMNRRYAA